MQEQIAQKLFEQIMQEKEKLVADIIVPKRICFIVENDAKLPKESVFWDKISEILEDKINEMNLIIPVSKHLEKINKQDPQIPYGKEEKKAKTRLELKRIQIGPSKDGKQIAAFLTIEGAFEVRPYTYFQYLLNPGRR